MAERINTQKKFEEIVERLTKLRAKKNNDYGDAFMTGYNAYGKQAIFFDLNRKFQRLENLLLREVELKVLNENIEDTLGDLAVMCINAMVWFDSLKGDNPWNKFMKKN